MRIRWSIGTICIAGIATVAITGCGGSGGASNSAVLKTKAALKRDMKALNPILAKMGLPGFHARVKLKNAKSLHLTNVTRFTAEVPVTGFDDTLGLWYSGGWDPYAYDFTYYSDQAMTVQVGTESYSSPDPTNSGGMVVYPATITYTLNITTGPSKQYAHWQDVDADGTGTNSSLTNEYIDAAGNDYAFTWATTNGVPSGSSTTTLVGGPTVTGTATVTPTGGQTLTWSDSTGEEGFFNINSDNTGSGTIGTGTATQATMTWDSTGQGTIVFSDGTSQSFTFTSG